jgi:hypothetical protein
MQPYQIDSITTDLLKSAATFPAYRASLETLMQENKTTGADQSANLLEYARLNLQRMRRIDKTVQVLPEIREQLSFIQQTMTWLYITEGWCGDAAQILGVIEAMAKTMPNVQTRVILRDEHPEVMEHFLTNGSKAIPIVVIMNAITGHVMGHWGPRPQVIQEQVNRWKAEEIPKEAMIERIHQWYAQDKTHNIQLDFGNALLRILNH